MLASRSAPKALGQALMHGERGSFVKTFVGLSAVALVLVMGCTTDQSREIAQLKQEISDLRSLAGPLPSSLDKLYPPEADGPVYQRSMLAMEASFAGVFFPGGSDPGHAAKLKKMNSTNDQQDHFLWANTQPATQVKGMKYCFY